MNVSLSDGNQNRQLPLIAHRSPYPYHGCGRPEAPHLAVDRFKGQGAYERFQNAVEDCPRRKVTFYRNDSVVHLPERPRYTLDLCGDYNFMTPWPVEIQTVRQTQQGDFLIGVGGGGATVVFVDRPGSPRGYPFIMHVDSDTYDAGIIMGENDEYAAVVALRPRAADIWFYGSMPPWAKALRANEPLGTSIRRLTWSLTRTERVLSILLMAVACSVCWLIISGRQLEVTVRERF